MSTVTTGRRLDDAGEPIAGTGFEIDAEGEVAALLSERTGPLISLPGAGIWSARLVPPAATDHAFERRLAVLAPEAAGPGEHVHAGSAESFEVVAGEVTVTAGGTDRSLGAGETVTVDAGVIHSFRNAGDAVAAFVVEIGPPTDTSAVIRTVAGLVHDDPGRRLPGPLDRLLLTAALDGDTVFPPPSARVQRALVPLLRPVARARYREAVETYADDAYWEHRVEQPAL